MLFPTQPPAESAGRAGAGRMSDPGVLGRTRAAIKAINGCSRHTRMAWGTPRLVRARDEVILSEEKPYIAPCTRGLAAMPIPLPIHGRGSSYNPPNRFERLHVEPDEWVDPDDPDPPSPETQILLDDTREILSQNDSPDLSFEHGINPYEDVRTDACTAPSRARRCSIPISCGGRSARSTKATRSPSSRSTRRAPRRRR